MTLATLAGSWVVGTGDAEARPDTRQERGAYGKRTAYKYSRQRRRPAPAPTPVKAETVKPPEGPLVAVVSLGKQRISVYGSTGLVAQSVVSSGRPGFPTPTGVFSIIQKNRHHRSNIYSGAPMPFMQRITWSGVALHAGVIPGYPASHGCIRLTHTFASELWGMTKMGYRVVVAPDEATVGEVAHAALPVPTMTPVVAQLDDGGTHTRPALVTLATTEDKPAEPLAASEATEPKVINPLERAREARTRTAADAVAKAKAAKAAVELSTAKAAEANKAIAAVRATAIALTAARSRRDAAAKAVEAAKAPAALERAQAALAAAEAKVTEAAQAAAEAEAAEPARTAEALAAARAAWDAEHASTAAAEAAKAADKGTEPISIFISRKAGRIYIRQAWAPVHEAPATFKDPAAILGTHLYVAVEPRRAGLDGMRWLSVSLPPEAARRAERQTRRGEKPAAEEAPQPRPTAAGVLDQIDMPQETRRFISERLWTGASLIVSDQGISNETGKYTDFIVLTR